MTNLPRISITVPDDKTKLGLRDAAKKNRTTISDMLLPAINKIIARKPRRK